ncbi:aminotransferase class I/II-fold pyridoxal phosphate-dependent enzyme [Maribacter sp. MMG018]|uniref:methionine aminotransferase n=1 Tax=Maribacter sp. MMG018 TaxID=2822688 RepID=UPI001B37A927|nr:methionine aminotransferase [Maribacter sp. MMG018]MBQ4913484.1 aminotransferase class I/II-fold pyridoxal phosphate-dependent enzyme [Maribacter sp. MMG018]
MSAMVPYISKLPNVQTTIFTTVGNLARTHGAIDLSQGFPNFEADPQLISLVSKAMREGHNQYAPMHGYYGLRAAISKKIYNQHNHLYDVEKEITVTVGATQAIFTAITAFIRPGDEVIVIKPAYDCYEPAIEVNGGIPVPLQLNKNGYIIDWDVFKQKITPRTKMVIINTPHNPSGRIFTKKDMLTLQEILKPTNIILLSDEVYEHIVFDGQQHESACRFHDLVQRSIVCASFGKTFHVTGWKIGYCAAPAKLMQEFRKTHQFAVFCVDHPKQRALSTYLNSEENYLKLNSFYEQKRNYFLKGLSGTNFKFTPTEGTYFQLLDYSNISDEGDEGFAKRLITEHGVACIPISSFNMKHRDDKMLRFCFAKKKETLSKALEILSRF